MFVNTKLVHGLALLFHPVCSLWLGLSSVEKGGAARERYACSFSLFPRPMRWRGFSETAYCNLTWQYDESKYLVADQAS